VPNLLLGVKIRQQINQLEGIIIRGGFLQSHRSHLKHIPGILRSNLLRHLQLHFVVDLGHYHMPGVEVLYKYITILIEVLSLFESGLSPSL
jgi:hypothetical protein